MRRKRTDGRNAFENIPDVLKAVSFSIEIVDDKGEPVSNSTFKVSVDGSSPRQQKTDQNGNLRILKPKSKVNITLVGKEAEGK